MKRGHTSTSCATDQQRHRTAKGTEMPNENEILTLGEAAEYLRIPVEKATELARERIIPGRVVGGEWRVSKTALTAWVSTPPGRIEFPYRGWFASDPVLWEEMFARWHHSMKLLEVILTKQDAALERLDWLLKGQPLVATQPQQMFRDFAGTFKDDPYLDKIVEEAYARRGSP